MTTLLSSPPNEQTPNKIAAAPDDHQDDLVCHISQIPLPPPTPYYVKIIRFVAKYVIFPFVWPLGGIYHLATGRALTWQDWQDLYRQANQPSIKNNDPHYQSPTVLNQVWQLPSARLYFQPNDFTTGETSILEYQLREGFCAMATLRSVIKSLLPPQLLSSIQLPTRSREGPKSPTDFCRAVEQLNIRNDNGNSNDKQAPLADNNGKDQQYTFQATIFTIDRSVSYQQFLSELQKNLNNPHVRVVCNFLRSSLFGFPLPWYAWPVAPVSFFFGLFAGHFSPLLGMIPPPPPPPPEDAIDNEKNSSENGNVGTSKTDRKTEPLIAVFDVNHSYGGVYLVPARRLYRACRTRDILTQQYRALIFVTYGEKAGDHGNKTEKEKLS